MGRKGGDNKRKKGKDKRKLTFQKYGKYTKRAARIKEKTSSIKKIKTITETKSKNTKK